VSDEPTEETPEETPVEETVEETPVEETSAAEAPAEEAPADDAPGDAAPAAAAEDEEEAEKPTSKQLRKRSRGAHTGEAKASRTNEERAAERTAIRAEKAASRRRWRARQKTKNAELRAANPVQPTPAKVVEPGNPKVRQGVVVSDKGEKTITVRIDVARRHPKYQKIVRSSSTLRVHDESNDANEGDTVRVIECRPMSRTKRWRLDEVLERAR
jgi:small subunit ribosomal protein S17